MECEGQALTMKYEQCSMFKIKYGTQSNQSHIGNTDYTIIHFQNVPAIYIYTTSQQQE